MKWNPFASRSPRPPRVRVVSTHGTRTRRAQRIGGQSRGRTTPADPGSRGFLYLPTQQAGVNVTEESSLGLTAVHACVRATAEPIGAMPWRAMEELGNGKRRTANEQAADWVLYKEPNPEMTPMSWRETIISHAETWGNGYSEIERDRAGRIASLWLLEPDRVFPDRDSRGRLIYDVWNGGGRPNTVLESHEMFHLHGLGFDGLRGYSVIEMHRKSIGLGLAQQEAGIALSANANVPAGIVQYKTNIDAKVAADTKREWNAIHGGPKNRGRIAVLAGDVDFKPITMPMDDAQYIESRQFTVEEVCRIFRVPPHKVQHLLRSTNNNIEHQSIEYVQDTLMPWIVRLEQEANRKLFGRNQRSRFYTKINVNALMRGDSQQRGAFYRLLQQMGVLNTNEIRELEDMGTIGPEGDKRLVELNMTTLERAGEEPAVPTSGSDTAIEETDLPVNLANRMNGRTNGHVHGN